MEKRESCKNPYKPEKRSHPQVQKSLWFFCVICHSPLQTTKKWQRTKPKVKAHVLETITMVKRKRQVKKLTSLIFCVSPWLDWDNLGLPAYNMQWHRCLQYEPLNLCKTNWMKKPELFWWQKHDDMKTNDASKSTHPLFFPNNTRKLDEEKNKSVIWWWCLLVLPHGVLKAELLPQ